MVKIIPSLEKNADLVRFVATPLGRVLVVLGFGVLLGCNRQGHTVQMTMALLAMTLFRRRRRIVLSVLTLGWTLSYAFLPWETVVSIGKTHGAAALVDRNLVKWLTVLAVLVCGLIYEEMSAPGRPLATRRPVRVLIISYLILLAIASYAPLGAVTVTLVWAFALVFGRYLWFIAMSVLDARSPDRPSAVARIGEHVPFSMMSSYAPQPKVGSYLRKIECRDDETLAVCQLKAVKLLLWCTLLRVLLFAFQTGIYGTPEDKFPIAIPRIVFVPGLDTLLLATASGHPASMGIAWSSVLGNFLVKLASLTLQGHYMIAIVRMAGFAALRNTDAPLRATSLAEFWNRLFYYFKELLVDVFYFPTYLTYFKRHPRLRLFFATLAAAGFGNFLFHFLLHGKWIAEVGLVRAAAGFHVYAIYCLVLGSAIGLSQLRNRGKPRRAPGAPAPLAPRLGVAAFYCLIGILDSPPRGIALVDYWPFFKSLVGA